MTEHEAAGIVLCGGRSTRMGYPKAFLPFGSETMVHRVVRLLATVVTPVVVVGAPGQVMPDLPSATLRATDARGRRGPLEGLRAGLEALTAREAIAYVTSCDAPLLIPGCVRRMIELLASDDIAVLEHDGYLHPLSAVYRRTVLPHVERLLAEDRLRPAYLFDLVRTRRVAPVEVRDVDPDLRTLYNVNSRADYVQALSMAGLTADETVLERLGHGDASGPGTTSDIA